MYLPFKTIYSYHYTEIFFCAQSNIRAIEGISYVFRILGSKTAEKPVVNSAFLW
ncbi:hypothetical protein TPHV1_90101 [Treponema phagedenis]|uniref:Uncharacterized protein n=1 Tax=Treponema phagedenis TaxID=162 RepID=A0A0B7H0R4_TREPH|nr:hypothetical protein TPHV1_90101 [Treponema phagedenis]